MDLWNVHDDNGHMSTTHTHYHSSEDDLAANDKWIAFGITVLAGFAAFIGAFSICCIKKSQLQYVIPVALSFSAGVIIHLSFLHIIGHTIEDFQFVLGDEVDGHQHHRRLLLSAGELDALSHFYTLLCIIVGIVLMIIFQKLGAKCGLDHDHHDFGYGSTELIETGNKDKNNDSDLNEHEEINIKQLSYNIGISLILHHFPEGIATYVAIMYEFEFGIVVMLALSLHDIPCGVAIATTIYCATGSYIKPFIFCLIAAIAYPLGAVIGYFFVEFNKDSELLSAILFGIVSGIMIYVALIQILPSAITQLNQLNNSKITMYSYIALFSGLLFMEISVILLALTHFHAH